MTSVDFPLRGEFIELNVLLKLLSIAPSGGLAKLMVAAGEVRVDGAVELRKTRKLRAGHVVTVGERTIRVVDPELAP